MLEREGIDCDYRKGGVLYTAARYPEQETRLRDYLKHLHAEGLTEDDYRWLDKSELAEQFWDLPGLPIRGFHADWSSQGPRAGFVRNQAMVDEAVSARSAGAVVSVLAFADLCQKEQCGDSDQHQLMDDLHFPGHFSHGTMHSRQAALNAGLQVRTIVHPILPPF